MPEGSVCYTLCFWLISRVLILLAAEERTIHTGPHHTVYSKRNAHLIQNFLCPPLVEEGQKFTWPIM